MIPFILGLFVGTTFGALIMSMLTVGKLTDLQTKIDLLQRNLEAEHDFSCRYLRDPRDPTQMNDDEWIDWAATNLYRRG